MPALLDSLPQLPSTCGWGALYPVVEETGKPHHLLAVPAAAKKQPAAYRGGRKKNLETCTEALGCETGGVDGCCDAAAEAERKRWASREVVVEEEEEEEMVKQGSACQSQSAPRRGRSPLPPPLTTLAMGTGRVRMVHQRRDGRLEVFAVRSPGILEAQRGEGRLRLRRLPLRLNGAGNDAAAAECCPQAPEADEKDEAAKEAEDGEKYGFAKFVRGGRCVDMEGGAAAVARLGKQWEPVQAAAFWVATS